MTTLAELDAVPVATAVAVAIIGAGVSGLACARALTAAGVSVRLFEKARKAGGRMSTRRGPKSLGFDHGAQYFTAREPEFAQEVARWEAGGVAQRWLGRVAIAEAGAVRRDLGVKVLASTPETPRYVGVPSMSAIARELALGLDVVSEVRIARLEPAGGQWTLVDEADQRHGPFTAVVIATPAAQAVPLLASAPVLADRAASVRMDPCWAVMLGFAERLEIAADGLFVYGSPLAWAARDSSKPGRGGAAAETWVLHATPEWTRQRWDDPPAAVIDGLRRALFDATGHAPVELIHADSHRWRYARADAPLPEPYLFDADLQIGACGDWCGGPRVEGAWLSGRALAARLLGSTRP